MAKRPQPALESNRWLRVVLGASALLLVVTVLSVFVTGAIALAIPILLAIPVLLALDWWRRRRFLKQYAGQFFVIVRRRRGWRDFLVNNVEPVLQPGGRLIWEDARAGYEGPAQYLRWQVKRRRGLRRPYAVAISDERPTIRVVPLHDALLPLKPHAKRSAATQAAVADILRELRISNFEL